MSRALEQHVGTYVETLRLAARRDAAWDTSSVRAALQWCVRRSLTSTSTPAPPPPTRAHSLQRNLRTVIVPRVGQPGS